MPDAPSAGEVVRRQALFVVVPGIVVFVAVLALFVATGRYHTNLSTALILLIVALPGLLGMIAYLRRSRVALRWGIVATVLYTIAAVLWLAGFWLLRDVSL